MRNRIEFEISDALRELASTVRDESLVEN